MIIKRMNRMFDVHGRTIGTILVIVIIIAFVGFFTPGFTSMLSPFFYGRTNEIGKVFGKNIDMETLKEEAQYLAIIYSLYNPAIKNIRYVSQMDFTLKNAAKVIPKLEAASKIGVTVSISQIAKYLRDVDRFKTDKKFDKKKFDKYVKEVLLKSGFNKADLDEAVKQQIILRNLYDIITDKVIVTEGELKAYFYNTKTKYKVKLISKTADAYKAKVKYTKKDLENFFNLQKDSYKIPARYKTIIAQFLYTNYKHKARESLKEEDILEYFKTSNKSFVKKEKDRLANLAEKEFDKKSEFQKIRNVFPYITYTRVLNYYERYKKESKEILPEVKEKIINELIESKIKNLAMNDARDFAQKVYEQMESSPAKGNETFKQIVKEFGGIKLITPGWISKDAKEIPGIGEEPELIDAISNIYQQIAISDAVKGKKAAYIVYLIKKETERQANFEEVKDKVKEDFIREKAINMAREDLRNTRLKVFNLLKKGKSIKEIEKKGIKFEDVQEFSGRYAPVGHSRILARLAAETDTGKLSKIENTSDGGLFIYVEYKKLPDEKEFDKQKSMLAYRYKLEKKSTAWSVFNEWLKSNAKFSKEFQ